jgi:alkylated DNA repair dioxygenase AlkB
MWSYHSKVLDPNKSWELYDETNEYMISEEIKGNTLCDRENQPIFQYLSDPPENKYKYFNTIVSGSKFPQFLLELQDIVEMALKLHPKYFNAAFINVYASGEDYIPWHRDSNHGNHYIASVSLYPGNYTEKDLRVLQIRNGASKVINSTEDLHDQVYNILMGQGSIVCMYPGMQDLYMHSVPPCDAENPRINITFRKEPIKLIN